MEHNGEMSGQETAVLDGAPGGIDTTPLKSYAEQVLDDIAASRDRVQRAIEHYEGQRAEILAHANARVAEIDGHLSALCAALTQTTMNAPAVSLPVTSNGAKRRGRPAHLGTWDRVEAYLREHGEVRHADIAKALDMHQAKVLGVLRSHADSTAIFARDGRQWARLK